MTDLESYKKINRNIKEKIYHTLIIDKQHKNFIDAISLLSYLKLYRKDTAFLLIYLTYKILDLFKNDFKKEHLQYLTLDEAVDLINGKLKITKRELANRQSSSLYLSQTKEVFTGKKVDEYIDDNVEKENISHNGDIKLLEGSTACLGKTGDWIYGTVKIINTSEDMISMEDGDILVSVATTPDILPAMKKASAIVTDLGGITCHAAIVSRELNVPCLIATKYATKVFKNGDKVIVCPRHGYIKFQ